MPPDPDYPFAGPNPLHPDKMSAKARLAEVGRTLAAGITRINGEKSSSLFAQNGDRFVDFTPLKSGDVPETRTRIGDKT